MTRPITLALAAALIVASSVESRAQVAPPPPAVQAVPPPPAAPGTPAPIPLVGTGVIIGQVVESGTKRGVASALVTLSGRGSQLRTLADNKGRFLFKRLPEGEFSIAASKPGLFAGAHGRRRPNGAGSAITLYDGQWIGGLTIDMWRPAAISGIVVDERNEPLTGVNVRATRKTIVGGARQFIAAGQDITDDHGMYRLSGLQPGEYVVSVPTINATMPASALEDIGATGSVRGEIMMLVMAGGGLPAAGSFLTGAISDAEGRNFLMNAGSATPPPPAKGRTFGYPTTLFPGATSLAGANILSVSSGQERAGVDFQLQPVPTAVVSGHVRGPNGPATSLSVALIPGGTGADPRTAEIDGTAARTISAGDGTFTLLNIPWGDYTLEIRQGAVASFAAVPMMAGAPPPPPPPPPPPSPPGVGPVAPMSDEVFWASVPITVRDGDLKDLAVELRPGLKLIGRLTFEGSAAKPTADALARIPILMESTSGLTQVRPARADAEGRFTLTGLTPGQFFVRIGGAPAGWTIRSILVNGVDVSDEALDLTSGIEPGEAVITFTDKVTTLSGTARSGALGALSAGNPDAAVLIFSAESRFLQANGTNPRRMRSLRVSTIGGYSVPLPPGDYFVVAIDEAMSDGWQDEAVLGKLRSAATRVTLREGDKKTQDLKVVAVK